VYSVYSVYSGYSGYSVYSVYGVYSVYSVYSMYSVYSVYSMCICLLNCSSALFFGRYSEGQEGQGCASRGTGWHQVSG
jgi:hypothetical protein